MAHYAKLDNFNNVINVIVIADEDTLVNGVESEQKGIDFCNSLQPGTWLKTSYNTIGGVHQYGGTPFRKNYASVGYKYDPIRDAFIPPQPYLSWTLNEETCLWEAPVDHDRDGGTWSWDKDTLNWVKVTEVAILP
jgi:hypothetical protein